MGANTRAQPAFLCQCLWLMGLGIFLLWTGLNLSWHIFQTDLSKQRAARCGGEGTESDPLPSSTSQQPPEIYFILTVMVKTNSVPMQVEILSGKNLGEKHILHSSYECLKTEAYKDIAEKVWHCSRVDASGVGWNDLVLKVRICIWFYTVMPWKK